MLRLRFFRVLLPLTLVLLVGALVVALRDRPPPQLPRSDQEVIGGPKATVFEMVDMDGSRKTLAISGDVVEEVGDKWRFENISNAEIYPLDGPALSISAGTGNIEGKAGERTMLFEEEVTLRVPEDGLILTLPTLDIDEGISEARSQGDVRFETPKIRGGASALIYRLDRKPAELTDPTFEDEMGRRLTAKRAVLLDGFDDVELRDDVELEGPRLGLEADRVRVVRDEEERIRETFISGGVRGEFLSADGVEIRVAGERLEADWDEDGEIEEFLLDEDAEVRRAGQALSAGTITAHREGAGELGAWTVRARDNIYLQGSWAGSPVWIRGDQLTAHFAASLVMTGAVAEGKVRLDAPDTWAEADRVTFSPLSFGNELHLVSPAPRKALLARGATRIAAESIHSDRAGTSIRAEKRVEATLLPSDDPSKRNGLQGMFRAEEAVHFVSENFESLDGGTRFRFLGGVRGWQGERNLSAGQVELDQTSRVLEATTSVATRFPRESEGVRRDSDYIQITADRLKYDDMARLAVYDKEVRIQLAEGWLEAARVEADLAEQGEGVREIRANESVRLEVRDTSEKSAGQMIAGTADRLVYSPGEQTIWLYGDDAPASVRRFGSDSGTTTGRVLRYRLDTGTLEVDSGDQGPARIRTNSGPG